MDSLEQAPTPRPVSLLAQPCTQAFRGSLCIDRVSPATERPRLERHWQLRVSLREMVAPLAAERPRLERRWLLRASPWERLALPLVEKAATLVQLPKT